MCPELAVGWKRRSEDESPLVNREIIKELLRQVLATASFRGHSSAYNEVVSSRIKGNCGDGKR